MAYITTEDNYMSMKCLCSKCGQEVKVDIVSGLSNGVTTWGQYQCQHCGHIGEVKDKPIKPFKSEHRAYSLDEILEMNREEKPIQEENALNRIADSLDEIKELLKEMARK